MIEGVWGFPGRPHIYAVYSGGYKRYLSEQAVAPTRKLVALKGKNSDIQVMNDPAMFEAFGEIVNDYPDDVNKFGLPI